MPLLSCTMLERDTTAPLTRNCAPEPLALNRRPGSPLAGSPRIVTALPSRLSVVMALFDPWMPVSSSGVHTTAADMAAWV